MKKKTLSRSLSIVILLCIGCTAFLCARAAAASFERIRNDYLELVRRKTGFDVSYKALSPSVLSGIRMSDISVIDSQTAVPILKIRSVKLKWNILKLIRGNTAEALGELLISGVHIDYNDLTQAAIRDRIFSLIKEAEKMGGGGSDAETAKTLPGINDILFSLPVKIRVKNVSVLYTDENIKNELHFANLRMIRSGENGVLQCSLSGKNSIQPLDQKKRDWGTFAAGFSAQANLTPNFENSFAQLRLSSLKESDYTFPALNMYASYADSTAQLSLMQNALPFSLSASVDPLSQNAAVKLYARDLNLIEAVKVKKKRGFLKQIDSCFVSGEYGAFWDGENKAFRYEADGSVKAAFATRETGTVSFRLTGDESNVRADFIDIKSSVIDAGYSGSFDLKNLRPQGNAHLRSLKLPNGNDISAELYMESFGNESLIFIPQLHVGETVLTALQLRLIGGGLSRDFTFEAYDYSKADIAGPGVIRINGSFAAAEQRYVQAQLSAENMFLDSACSIAVSCLPEKEAAKLSPLIPLFRPYIFSFDLFASTDFKSITYNTPYAVIANTKKDNELLLFSVDGTESVFQISRFDMLTSGQSVQLEANADISSWLHSAKHAKKRGADSVSGAEGEIFFSSSLFINSIPYAFSGVYVPQKFLNISGDYNLNASFSADKDGVFTGSLSLLSLPLAVNELVFSSSASIRFLYDKGYWRADIDSIETAEISKKLRVSPRVRVSGVAEPGGIYLNKTAYSDELSSLNGSINILWNFDANVFESLSLNASLTDSFSPEMYSLWLQAHNPERVENAALKFSEHIYFSSEAEVRSAPAARFAGFQNESNTFSAKLTALGTAENLSVQLNIDNASFVAGKYDVRITGAANLENDNLTLSGFDIHYGLLDFKDLNGDFSLKTTAGRLDGMLSGRVSDDMHFKEKTFHSPFVLNLFPLDADDSKPFKEKAFKAELLFPRLEGSFFKPAQNYKVSLTRTPGRFDISAGFSGELEGSISDSGEIYFKADGDFPIHFNAFGIVGKGELSVLVDEISADAKTFSGLLDLPVFSLYSGSAVGRGTITGPLNNPLINAEFRGTDMLVGVPDYIDEKMLCKDFRVKTVNNVFSAVNSIFTGEKTGAKVDLSVDLGLDKMAFDFVSLSAKTLGNSRAAGKYRMPYGVFTGTAKADIALQVDTETVDVRGVIEADNLEAIITLTPEELPVQQESEMDTIVDLTVLTGNKPRLFIPSKTNPFVRGLVTQTEPLHIQIDTRYGTSSFTGSFSMKGGEILYLNRTFYVREASAILNESMEVFDPHLSAKAEIRERDAGGDPVRIMLTVADQPLSRLNPAFSSIPVKSRQEIMTLLGRIFLADDGRGNANPIALIGSLADYGAQITVFRGIENRLRDFLKFDIFSLRTMFLQNTFTNALNLNTGQNLNAGNFLDNTTVYIGKYFGDTIYADAMLHLAYDKNLEKREGDTGGLIFQPEIGLELPSPFAAIRWSIAPELNSDWKLLVPHTSISLSWKFNF